ncbi:HAD family hydrolase [Glycomyces rhizosphaerae]|uniref:HAD family hydrolase n=1 Tax=Glycomyces rhizosphaerae TaxID=2054422 RepID=A0ABV7Q1I3_9ACTN
MTSLKVIATDLDGTLLHRGRLSERNQKALLAARERGIQVVAVTARAPRGVHRHSELAASIDAAICCNGAMTYDFTSGTADLRHPIPIPTARQLQRRLLEVMPQARFAVETGESQIAQDPEFAVGVHLHDPWYFVDPTAELLDGVDAVATFVVRAPGLDAATLVAKARQIDMPGVRMWHWGSYPEIEYSSHCATKGLALAEWCAAQGIGPESVVAFGDMPTDVPMLAWAGRSFAMADANTEALAASTDRTGSCADDGVAQAIEALLDERAT